MEPDSRYVSVSSSRLYLGTPHRVSTVIDGTGTFHPSPSHPLPPSLLYCRPRDGAIPLRAGGISNWYWRLAVPRLFAAGGAIMLIFDVGSAALMSFIIVGAKPSVSGDSGAWMTPFIMSVKCVVLDTTQADSLSTATRSRATQCLVSLSK